MSYSRVWWPLRSDYLHFSLGVIALVVLSENCLQTPLAKEAPHSKLIFSTLVVIFGTILLSGKLPDWRVESVHGKVFSDEFSKLLNCQYLR